mmetsp:Transcript_141571/g.394590  ORF Transcript_141571/g.394590 Transcript_141571/m.394590 type:complete len:269 (-) Transcript_141571:35-841(-)
MRHRRLSPCRAPPRLLCGKKGRIRINNAELNACVANHTHRGARSWPKRPRKWERTSPRSVGVSAEKPMASAMDAISVHSSAERTFRKIKDPVTPWTRSSCNGRTGGRSRRSAPSASAKIGTSPPRTSACSDPTCRKCSPKRRVLLCGCRLPTTGGVAAKRRGLRSRLSILAESHVPRVAAPAEHQPPAPVRGPLPRGLSPRSLSSAARRRPAASARLCGGLRLAVAVSGARLRCAWTCMGTCPTCHCLARAMPRTRWVAQERLEGRNG